MVSNQRLHEILKEENENKLITAEESKALIALARDGLLHRALSSQTGAEPIAVRWMRWAQEVAVPHLEHEWEEDHRWVTKGVLDKAPKEE